MLTLPRSVRVFVASTPIDMRRGHDGLLAVVQSTWGLDPYSGHIFAFLSPRLDRAKLLYWDRGGLVLVYKRLEQGHFKLPTIEPDAERVEIDGAQLSMLLACIDFSRMSRPKAWMPPEPQQPIDRRVQL